MSEKWAFFQVYPAIKSLFRPKVSLIWWKFGNSLGIDYFSQPFGQVNWVPMVIWDCSSSLCDWSWKRALLSQPIRCKTKTNHDWVTCIFVRFTRTVRFHSEFLSAPGDIFLSFHWWLFWFFFHNTQSKTALWADTVSFIFWSLHCPLLSDGYYTRSDFYWVNRCDIE